MESSWSLVVVENSWSQVVVENSWSLVVVESSWSLVAAERSQLLVVVESSWSLVAAAGRCGELAVTGTEAQRILLACSGYVVSQQAVFGLAKGRRRSESNNKSQSQKGQPTTERGSGQACQAMMSEDSAILGLKFQLRLHTCTGIYFVAVAWPISSCFNICCNVAAFV